MRKFSGLCIGGPYDGKRFVSERRTFRVEEQPPAPAFGTEPISDKVVTTIHTYVHHDIDPSLGVGVFVPEKVRLGEALAEVLLMYERAKQ